MKPLVIMTLVALALSIMIWEGEANNMDAIGVELNFSQVPKEFTCLGKNISPEIGLTGAKAKSLALILEDPDAPRGFFTHWIMWNIDPVSKIPQGIPNVPIVEKPIVAVQGLNSGGKIGYSGPCPPPGKPHRYFFKVYGLDTNLNLKAGSNRSQMEAAMKGHIVQQGEAMATFGR